ncbi:hydrolase [Gordonia phage AnClar]|nr:hydrolase [Gordonia phage AnClar]
MAHELDITNGVASYADSRTDAWHQLGTQVGHLMTADEALAAAHMTGWNVRKEPLLAQVGDELLPVDDKFASVRTNPITGKAETLGVVGNWWTPFQNEDTTALLGEIVRGNGGVRYSWAGADALVAAEQAAGVPQASPFRAQEHRPAAAESMGGHQAPIVHHTEYAKGGAIRTGGEGLGDFGGCGNGPY